MTSPNPIRVLIVDDHALFRSGIRSLLRRHTEFEVIDDIADGLEGIKRARSLRPDVVLLDIHMPGLSGREALRCIVESVPRIRVLMLTVSEDINDLLDCLEAGAAGYLLKNIGTATLVDALHRATRGESIVSPQMTALLIERCRRPGAEEQPPVREEAVRLTGREREVLGRLAAGDSNREIAENLGLAESTVKIHLQSIFRKFNLGSRTQAVVYAAEHGLLDAPPAGRYAAATAPGISSARKR